jgi:hypothetical protein
MRHVITAVCLLTLLAGASFSESVTVSTDPLVVSVQREPTNMQDPIFRAFITVGEHKFTFIIPERFSSGGDPAHGRLQFKTLQGDSTISFAFVNSDSSSTEGFSPEVYKQALTERYPSGKIIKEFSNPVCGHKGSGFDVTWVSTNGLPQTTRTIYFGTEVGIIELSVTAGTKKFKDARIALNEIFSTFNSSVNGKLVVMHIGGPN